MKGERELNMFYSDASRQLRSMLLGIDPTSFNERLGMKIEDRARMVITALNAEIYEWANTYLKEAYRIGAGKARTALEILGKKPNRLLIRTERIFIDDTVELLIQRNNTIRKSVRDFLSIAALAARGIRSVQIQEWSYAEAAADLDELMNKALIEQKSRGWLAAQILDYLRTMVSDGELIDINGKMWRMNKYSKMVARTTLRTAQSKATGDLCQQYDNDLVEISDHGTDCEICLPYEGRVFSISGRTPGYDILDEWPPLHPNCMHSALPTSEEAIAVRGRAH